MASMEKTLLNSLGHRYGGKLTTTHGHLRQKLRLNQWKPGQVRELIDRLANQGVIKVTKTPTHITVELTATD